MWFYSHPSYADKRLDNLSYMIWILILYSDERIFKILLFYYVVCCFTII